MVNTREIRNWFSQHITDNGKPYLIDKHQARVIADTHKNTLVTARAGSGKTRTIVAKVVYLIAHEKISPDQIIVFAFNKKARAEVNARLNLIAYNGKPIFEQSVEIATTFHAFAYKILHENYPLGANLITEEHERRIIARIVREVIPNAKTLKPQDFNKVVGTAQQFITRAEQKFFMDYRELDRTIIKRSKQPITDKLQALNLILKQYQTLLQQEKLINFNQMVAQAATIIAKQRTPYRYIFVDEYQDFSLLFLTLIQNFRQSRPTAHLLCVGDDWQAINRFAGSDVEYFLHFAKYFPEDHTKLFLPTNYRSGKKIVKNANYFMSRAVGDYKGCKSGNKTKAGIYYRNINYGNHANEDIPLLLENYFRTILRVIKDNPGKTIKILHRNNNLSFQNWNLDKFIRTLRELAINNHLLSLESAEKMITYSTIHRSKGLESDIVILLEIDAEKFPSQDKTAGLYEIFGDTSKNLFADEARLFYVALTRPREKLFILSKTTTFITTKENKQKQKYNFFKYLNDAWLEEM